MKTTNTNKTLLLGLIAVMGVGSCTDDTFMNNDPIRQPSDLIRFEVSSGFGEDNSKTRSGEALSEDEELKPLVLTEGKDTLYLHRYVAPEIERSTGHNPYADTRAAQVKDINDFKSVNGEDGFLVKAILTDNNDVFFPLSSAIPLASENAGNDIWYLKNQDPTYRYWPDDRKLRFHALAPASSEDLLEHLSLENIGQITFKYTVPVSSSTPRRDAELQPDLMLATTECSHTSGTIDCDYVPLNFRHALSAIKFAVRDVIGGEIVDISIKGVAGSGDCLFKNPVAESDGNGFRWYNLGDPVDYVQTFNYKTTDTYPNIPSLADAPVINTLMPEKTFMLIPQAIPEEAMLEITFKSGEGGTPKTLSGKLKTSDIPLWEPGKEYVYTISTSSENWTYVFDVKGSVQEDTKDPFAGTFIQNDESIIINHSVTEGAYYKVKSYRFRTNNPSKTEPVKWTGTVLEADASGTVPDYCINSTSNGDIKNYISQYKGRIKMVSTPEQWFLQGMNFTNDVNNYDLKDTFEGAGSEGFTQYNIVFNSQYVATSWGGDWEMRAKDPVEGIDKEHPIDLSLRNGGENIRNTANCYVVNRAGWYAIPLYYGNSITDGKENSGAYIYDNGTSHSEHGYSTLTRFVDYTGNTAIAQPKIQGVKDATLVWSDAYNIITSDEVFLGTSLEGEDCVIFHIRQEDLQQSNSIIAVRNSNGEIIWSWHIWVSEYWVNDRQVLGNNDVNCESWDANAPISEFTVAPRNLGWCDPKVVGYLKRTGTLKFIQDKPVKGSETKPTKELYVEQREKLIEYWIGNNTYYQWGRKDPMVGFKNHEDEVKYNFGPYKYKIQTPSDQARTIGNSIKNPNVLFVGSAISDWLASSTNYYNLWNNYRGTGDYLTKQGSENTEPNCNAPLLFEDFAYSAIKTVYDPSPAGYVVPPASFFELFTKGRNLADYSNIGRQGTTLKKGFNGNFEKMSNAQGANSDRYYELIGNTTRNGTNPQIVLTPTGQRWDKADRYDASGNLMWPSGGNMNPFIVYLWTNTCSFDNNGDSRGTAFSFVIGQDAEITPSNENVFILTTHFYARKSMARPVRSVKEFQEL